MIAYTVKTDEVLLEEYLQRVRAQSASRFGLYGLKVICYLGLLALIAISLWGRVFALSAIPAFFLALLLAGPRFDYWWAKRRLRKSPFYGRSATATLNAAGYTEVSSLSSQTLAWDAFTKAVRMEDGFLLALGPNQWHWLPDRALVAGTVAEVEQFLKEKVGAYAA